VTVVEKSPEVVREEESIKNDRLAHIRDKTKQIPHGLCGARILGVPARPQVPLCIVCTELAFSHKGRMA
jgi:hypothetical protein